MNIQRIALYIDLLFCLIFLPLIISMVPVEKWLVRYPLFACTLFLSLYVVYFAIRKMNIPRKAMQRKYVQIGVFVVVIIGAAYLLSQFPYPPGYEIQNTSCPNMRRILRRQTVCFMFLVVGGYSLSVSLLIELFQAAFEKKKLESEKQQAELALYKAQINPHFFFNTMNTLYGLVVSKSDKAETAFMYFTELLKYTYYHVNTDKIAIKTETAYIQNYIELQRLRLNQHTVVNYNFEIDDDTVQVPPMLFISFVENAFKYGVSSTTNCLIDISISVKARKLTFLCTNNIMKQERKEEISVGLENTRARLDLMYANRYTLDISDRNNRFSVNLEIRDL